ncbi:MAG: helix-turn-helix domain-containing protein [Bacteroidota bacterium]
MPEYVNPQDAEHPNRRVAAVKRGRKASGPTPYRNVGERLELFRMAKGISTHKEFISQTSISGSAYSDVENGKKSLGLKTAMKLIARHPELSLDYLYMGRVGTIDSIPLVNAIAEMIARRAR